MLVFNGIDLFFYSKLMYNPRITKKERGLLKGAIRRVFSRSELRKKVLDLAIIQYLDKNRPRVKKWVKCAICKTPSAAYQAQVDHISPLVPLELSAIDLDMNTLTNRLWCEENNLQVLCITCHKYKSMLESKQRRQLKKRNAK